MELNILDKGFGTAYEKFVIGKIFDNLVQKHSIKTVCEYPTNDLMENNSSEFETLCCKVTRQPLNEPVKSEDKYDLVWCFCEVEQQEDPSILITNILNKSNRYVLIVTQNKRNLGVPLHYLYHVLSGRKWDHGKVKNMALSTVERELNDSKISIIHRGAFDVPWFILDVYEAGSVLLRLIPKSLLGQSTKQTDLKDSKFEKLPYPIKKWLSHHVYILIEKKASPRAD
jgi:hypothetical protein